jgi:hypothetical protein
LPGPEDREIIKSINETYRVRRQGEPGDGVFPAFPRLLSCIPCELSFGRPGNHEKQMYSRTADYFSLAQRDDGWYYRFIIIAHNIKAHN